MRWADLRKGLQQARAHMDLHAELGTLDEKLRIVLPPEYQSTYDEVQPVSMGTAGLKFDNAGRVAWDEIWGSFCDLAMAGGPPHKGKLLEPGAKADIDAQPEQYRAAVLEICRGIRMVSDVAVEPSPNPGWVRVMCATETMAGWLARAIAMENVSAHVDGTTLELPAGPHFRVEKEIKNVVTAIAKTCHYFEGHLAPAEQRRIGMVFAGSGEPLLQPWRSVDQSASEDRVRAATAAAAAKITHATGLTPGSPEYLGWLGLACPDIASAIWMMRALVIYNTLARREDCRLYLPIHPALDPAAERVTAAISKVHRLAAARGVLPLVVESQPAR